MRDMEWVLLIALIGVSKQRQTSTLTSFDSSKAAKTPTNTDNLGARGTVGGR